MIFHQNTSDFKGIEFAVFKLKDGVTEEKLIELSKKVDEGFLRNQNELLAHFLLKGSENTYADVAIATTQEKAEEYCSQWLENSIALQYLELIDSDTVNMTFWSRVT